MSDVRIALNTFPRSELIGLAVALLTVLGVILAILFAAGRSTRLAARLVTFSISGLVVLLSAQTWASGAPGRAAADETRDWRTVARADWNSGAAPAPNHPNLKGQATARLENGRLLVNLQSFRDATQVALPEGPPVGDFYVAVDESKRSGSADAWCGILFRFVGDDAWFMFKVREHEWMLTEDVGTPDHNLLAGPVRTATIKRRNRLAVLSRGERVRFYINNVAVLEKRIPRRVGRVWIGLQAPNQRSAVECEYDNYLLHAR